MCNWLTLLYIWNENNIVNQLQLKKKVISSVCGKNKNNLFDLKLYIHTPCSFP